MTRAEWSLAATRLSSRQARNGTPDNETIDRRRVDPPAGCRVTAEPAILTGRRSVECDK
jgi:hypothetical protein